MKDTMKADDKIKYYCFNKKCKGSIFNVDSCTVVEVSTLKTRDGSYFCQYCFKELISKQDLNIKIQISHLLTEERLFTSLIVDDDIDYQTSAKALFNSSSTFNGPEQYTDGNMAINYLAENKGKVNVIPDFIFVDVNMPDMDGWEFLDELAVIYPYFKKEINVYVISNHIHPSYKEKARNRPLVKGIMAKNFDLRFLNNVMA